VRTVGLLSAAVVVPMALLAHPLVSILLGSSYRGVAPSLAIVALGSLPQLVGTPVGNAISGEGAVGVNAAIGAVSLVVALGGAAALAPRYHVTGAAVALAASMVVLGTSTLVAGWARYAERLPRAVGSHS
jgi:O-antigen/teichoic acid export membrane protein